MNGRFLNGYRPTDYIKDKPKTIVKIELRNKEKRFYRVNNRVLKDSYASLRKYFENEDIRYITYYTGTTTIYYEYL